MYLVKIWLYESGDTEHHCFDDMEMAVKWLHAAKERYYQFRIYKELT